MPAITNLGTYKIVRQLGSGLMGPVYLATSQNAYWAVRHIDETLIRTTGAMSKLVGDVLHPSLVRYKEVGADPQAGGFVSTDFIDARPISRDGLAGLRAAARLSFVVNLLEGLSVLHKRGSVHGAVKPSNVLLRRKGAQADGIFIDAGFMYVAAPANQARLLRGTYPFLAPELIEAYLTGDRASIEKVLTVKADVYSAGLLVAEILSGRQMFADPRSPQDLLQRIRSGTVEVSGVNDPLPHLDLARLNQAIKSAVNIDPGARTATIRQLIDELTQCLPKPEPAAAAPGA